MKCGHTYLAIPSIAQMCVDAPSAWGTYVFVCVCLSTCFRAPLFKVLLGWSEKLPVTNLRGRLASLRQQHKVTDKTAQRAGWSELWKEAVLQLRQAWSKEEQSWSIAQGQLAEQKMAMIQGSGASKQRNEAGQRAPGYMALKEGLWRGSPSYYFWVFLWLFLQFFFSSSSSF